MNMPTPTPITDAQEPSLRELIDQMQALPEDVRELTKRLTSLSTAAHVAAATLLQHGTNGLASCDNVARLYADVQTILKRFDPPATKQAKVWSLAWLTTSTDLQALHNRRKSQPLCLGCMNPIGFYQNGKYLGTVKAIGRAFQQVRAGDLVQLAQAGWFGKTQLKLLTIERIEGLMVHLKELSDDDRARAKNARDPVRFGFAPGPRLVPPRTRGDQ